MVSIMWSKGDRDRPFYLDRIHLPYIPPAIMEMIICSTLTHRILRVSHNMDSETCKTLARRLQEHRGKSIRLLSEELASPQFYTFSTLVCVFAFLLCEVSLKNPILFFCISNWIIIRFSNASIPIGYSTAKGHML